MSIGLLFGAIFAVVAIGILGWGMAVNSTTKKNEIKIIIFTLLIIAGIVVGAICFSKTPIGKRLYIDQKSELGGGLERVINVYTADGDLMATYYGKIDIETNDGGYVKFDYDGHRYIYYNCFVETIADID